MLRSLITVVALLSPVAFAADCKFAVVGKPHGGCYDIANAAGISTDQLNSYNPGLNCNVLQPDQRLCVSSGILPDISPKPNPDGSCATHKVAPDSNCAVIANKYGLTNAKIEEYNSKTYKFKGCANLQANAVICISSGTPPPIPVNDKLQCGPESPGNKECPLNACCSAFGFCGLTDTFCKPAPNGDPCISNCGTPTPKTCSPNLKRKLAYYAGWGSRRPCDALKPENLDLEGITDLIFAFATITQGNEITLEQADNQLLKDVVGLKQRYPGLKVTIAIGGWAFSMDDPTSDLFSIMISTQANRSKFIASCNAFIAKYGLDGIDIDMEYPAAMERSGPATDTPSLTAFFKEAKAGLGGKIVSVAAPAGYWFLKGFEIDKVVDHVDYINMMSYDFHGAWDKDVDEEDGTAKPHTSSLDIMDAINLYTRAEVDLSKVNLGMAWYGRTYNTGGCKGMKCKFSSGGTAGKCTGESSILSQTEIWDDIKANGITPTYDSKTHTYWYNRGDDFVTYDDEESWKYKTEMAGKYCFGGTFVWSMDLGKKHDALPPTPPAADVEVGCNHKMPNSEFLGNCLKMVNEIVDTNEYDLGGDDKCETVANAVRPFGCYKDCCLNIAVGDFKDVKVRAKEVKDAALEILSTCHNADTGRLSTRSLNRRALPLLALVPALIAKWVSAKFVIMVVGWVITLYEGLMNALSGAADEEARGEYVNEHVTAMRADHPEFNVIMAHTGHEGRFEEPCYHAHVEFDRPFPIPGTIGYEIYLARRGNFTLTGDGGFQNWAYSGYISADADNSKELAIHAPGAGYGWAAPVQGKYTEGGQTKEIEMIISLSSPDGCATSLEVNVGAPKPQVRCTDIEIESPSKRSISN